MIGCRCQVVPGHTGEGSANLHRLTTAGLWQLADIYYYYRLETSEPALKVLELLHRRDPRDSKVKILRGKDYKLVGNLDRAQVSFQKCLKESPKNEPASFKIG